MLRLSEIISERKPPYQKRRRWMGCAWENWDECTTQTIIFPFNWICGWLRGIYYRLMRGPRHNVIDNAVQKETTRISSAYYDSLDRESERKAKFMFELFMKQHPELRVKIPKETDGTSG